MFSAVCRYCGTEYWSHNPRRYYCSERCRRQYQNNRRLAERAELREAREREAWDEKPHWQQDPWAWDGRDDLDAWQTVWAQALLDPMPIDDAPWDQPAIQQPRKTRKMRKRKRQKNDGWLWLPGVPQW